MKKLKKRSLRSVLTIPYVLVIVCLALIIGFMSYQAGNRSVYSVFDALLKETTRRIVQAIDLHVVGSAPVLEAAFPTGTAAPDDIREDYFAMRSRFWIAASIYTQPNDYVYYGNKLGQSFALLRLPGNEALIRKKFYPDAHRRHFSLEGINGTERFIQTDETLFDPRQRPWYLTASESTGDIWTSIYIDYNTQELVTTRARRVLNEEGQFSGVVATDMSLGSLNTFVKNLSISANGMALILEPDGKIIASSLSKNVMRKDTGQSMRIQADQSENPYVVGLYESIMADERARGEKVTGLDQNYIDEINTLLFEDDTHGEVLAAYVRVRDNAGLEWIVAVAVPNNDVMGDVNSNVIITAVISMVAALICIVIGLFLVNWVSGDIRRLSMAAKLIGQGKVNIPINIDRDDEIGELANQFRIMQSKLQTDLLTQLYTREAFEKLVDQKIKISNPSNKETFFAILFIDIDQFKLVNDTMGHHVGDLVIKAIAKRLKQAVRGNDVIGRYAGDEFVVLLNDIDDMEKAEMITNKIRNIFLNGILDANDSERVDAANLADQDDDNIMKPLLSCSIGVAIYPNDGYNAASLLHIADQRMFEEKRKNKSRLPREELHSD